MQADVQAAMPETRVLVVRPVIFDFGILIRRIIGSEDGAKFSAARLKEITERHNALPEGERQAALLKYLSDAFSPVSKSWGNAAVPTLKQLGELVSQIVTLDWKSIGEEIQAGSAAGEVLDLTPLWKLDSMELDRRWGICPIPLFEFTQADWDILMDPRRTEDLQERLRDLGIEQFFFPPPDQLALALIDEGSSTPDQVIQVVEQAREFGHPLARPELVGNLGKLGDVIDALKERGLVVEGELALEVSFPDGSLVRSKVKYRPREGLIFKLLRAVRPDITVKF